MQIEKESNTSNSQINILNKEVEEKLQLIGNKIQTFISLNNQNNNHLQKLEVQFKELKNNESENQNDQLDQLEYEQIIQEMQKEIEELEFQNLQMETKGKCELISQNSFIENLINKENSFITEINLIAESINDKQIVNSLQNIEQHYIQNNQFVIKYVEALDQKYEGHVSEVLKTEEQKYNESTRMNESNTLSLDNCQPKEQLDDLISDFDSFYLSNDNYFSEQDGLESAFNQIKEKMDILAQLIDNNDSKVIFGELVNLFTSAEKEVEDCIKKNNYIKETNHNLMQESQKDQEEHKELTVECAKYKNQIAALTEEKNKVHEEMEEIVEQLLNKK